MFECYVSEPRVSIVLLHLRGDRRMPIERSPLFEEYGSRAGRVKAFFVPTRLA